MAALQKAGRRMPGVEFEATNFRGESRMKMFARISPRARGNFCITLCYLALLCAALQVRADEPYARSKDYDLQNSRIAMRFEVDHKKIIGDVTHTVSVLRNGLDKLSFDSVGLHIQSVTVNKASAKFESTDSKLNVSSPKAAKAGDKFEVEIKYDGKPSKGIYFILPDKDYPNRPKQIWTQGESEDTRYYLPTYDYPNDRLTTETIVTVPADWLTIGNGKLIGITDAGEGLKTWTWRESQPSSTYLITIVAGELSEVKARWREMPVTYYAPKDRADRLSLNYGRTPAMIDLFSKKLGVDYPWEKYAQAMVDDFVAGGMENSSATTNTADSLRHPQLAPEYPRGEDDLISHELGHQWFGDLVTTKDWGDIWLNEGFATFMETVWTEAHFGKEEADYNRWETARHWTAEADLYKKPVVRHDFADSSEFDGNAYAKGGWVLYMLRHQLGEDAFYGGLKHYLEVNRGKNVTTADLIRALEEATHINVDQFFDQWIYGAGAPKLEINYAYDAEKKQVTLAVKQTQKREGYVGLFRFPVDVEITNAGGPKLFPVVVSKESEAFTFPSDSAPLMVLFDKGTQILKVVEFKKEKKDLIYQLKNAGELADRADAAVALGKLKNDDDAANALGDALRNDKAYGVKITAAAALGDGGGKNAAKQLLDSLASAKEPWVRANIVMALGNFKDDATVAAKLEALAREESSFRARSAALQAIGKLKTPTAFDTLTAAVKSDSPDGFLRNAALRGLGALGDDRAVPVLREWVTAGKPLDSRQAAIGSLARLDKENKELTAFIANFLNEPHPTMRFATIFALGTRGDALAIPALENLLQADDLSIEMVPMIKGQITKLKAPKGKGPMRPNAEAEEGGDPEGDAKGEAEDTQRIIHLEELVEQMNERLKSIEGRLPPA